MADENRKVKEQMQTNKQCENRKRNQIQKSIIQLLHTIHGGIDRRKIQITSRLVRISILHQDDGMCSLLTSWHFGNTETTNVSIP